MLDQTSLKLLLRARAELRAAMVLAGKRVRQKPAQDPAPLLLVDRDLPSSSRVRAMAASTHS
jgi:hypothetical protein